MKQKGVRMANNEVRAEDKAHVGDKFVLKVRAVYWSPHIGNRYFIEGWDNLLLTDREIEVLKKYEDPKEVLHTCENCKHRHYEREMPPCSMCENNYDIETADMFEPKNGK